MDLEALSPLARAVALGQKEEVVQLIENGAVIDDMDATVDINPIIVAVQQGQRDVLRTLIRLAKCPPDLNKITSSGMTALKAAVLTKDLDSVNILLGNGARADVTNASGVTALMLAVLIGMKTEVSLRNAYNAQHSRSCFNRCLI